MFVTFIFGIIAATLVGAVLGRIDGGGVMKMNEWLERFLIMSFFFVACLPHSPWYAVFAFLGMFGIATGHGQYFLAVVVKAIEPERLDFIVKWFFGEDPRTNDRYKKFRGTSPDILSKHYYSTYSSIWQDMLDYGLNKMYKRKLFGMFVTGTLVGLPAAVIVLAEGHLIGLLFLLTGVAKALAYHIGAEVFENTESAEYINGGIRTFLAAVVFVFGLTTLIGA